MLESHALLGDLADTGFQVYGHLVGLEEIAQIRGVGKADALGGDQVVLHLHNGGLLALQIQLIRDLAAGQAAADDDHLVAHRLVTQQEIHRLNSALGTRNRDALCHSAGCHDNLVGIQGLDVLDLGIELDLNGILGHLTVIPRDQIAILFLERGGCSRDEHAAQLVALFIQSDLVASLGTHQSRLHTANAAADDCDLLLLLGGLDVIFLGLHGLRIERTARKTHGICQILGVGMSLGTREIEAAGMAADTGLDILKSVLDQLGHPFGVNQELACNAHAVNSALGDGLGTYLGIHTAGTNHGNVHKLLDVGNVLKVAVFGHVHRRMCPIPGVVGAVIGVEHIVACILQELDCLFGLLHGTAYLYVVLTRHSTLAKALHLGLYRVAQRNGIIRTALFLDGLDDLGCKAIAVFKAAAILVGTLVEEFHGKLVQQVSLMHRMHLNAVHACILTQLCGFGKGLDNLMDLLYRDLGADDIVCPTRGLGAGAGKLVAGIQHRLDQRTGQLVFVQGSHQVSNRPGATHACGQLNEQLGTRLMDFLHKFLKILKHLGVLPQILAPEGIAHGCDAGDDQTHVVVGSLQKQLGGLLVKMAACQLKPTEQRRAAHGAHDNAVFDFDVADLPRRK